MALAIEEEERPQLTQIAKIQIRTATLLRKKCIRMSRLQVAVVVDRIKWSMNEKDEFSTDRETGIFQEVSTTQSFVFTI